MFNNALFLKVRYPVLLTPAEKHMARGVCHAFRQAVILFTFDSYTWFFLPAYMQESFPLHLAGIYYIIVSVVHHAMLKYAIHASLYLLHVYVLNEGIICSIEDSNDNYLVIFR